MTQYRLYEKRPCGKNEPQGLFSQLTFVSGTRIFSTPGIPSRDIVLKVLRSSKTISASRLAEN